MSIVDIKQVENADDDEDAASQADLLNSFECLVIFAPNQKTASSESNTIKRWCKLHEATERYEKIKPFVSSNDNKDTGKISAFSMLSKYSTALLGILNNKNTLREIKLIAGKISVADDYSSPS